MTLSAAADMVEVSRSLFDRGLTPGSTGNVSVRTDAGLLITPSGRCMGRLGENDLVTVDLAGHTLSGPAPSKELGLHLALYRSQPAARAVVHLHSPYATAVSCLANVDPDQALGALTGYHVMKVGRLALVPYHPPGSPDLVAALEDALVHADAGLLANHGSIVAALTLEGAADAAEQIEQSAHIYLLVGHLATRPVPRRGALT